MPREDPLKVKGRGTGFPLTYHRVSTSSPSHPFQPSYEEDPFELYICLKPNVAFEMKSFATKSERM